MVGSVLASRAFWVATAERAVKTLAQSGAALLGGNGLGLVDVDWLDVLNVSALAAVASVLTSVASAGVGQQGPSLASERIASPAPTPQRRRVDGAA